MFNFFEMAGNIDQRRVDVYEEGDVFVSTVSINDSDKPYETAVCHPDYNDNSLIIVEMYDTKDEAQKGHDKWVKTMTAKKLPEEIRDVSTAEVASLSDACGEEWRVYKRLKGEVT